MQDAVNLYQHVFNHPKVSAAWRLSAELHDNDTYGAQSYINHLHEVAELLFWNYPQRKLLYVNGRVRHSDHLDRLVDEICAAFLHDVLEDHPDKITLDDIKGEFGERVGRIVQLCSDIDVEQPVFQRNAANWRERKQWYLDRLVSKANKMDDPDVISYLRVSCADKYANTQATLHHHREKMLLGREHEFWQQFKAHRDDRLWYDNKLCDIFTDLGTRIPEEMKPYILPLVEGLQRVTEAVNMRAQYLPDDLAEVEAVIAAKRDVPAPAFIN